MVHGEATPSQQCEAMTRFKALMPEYIKRLEQLEEIKQVAQQLPDVIKRLDKIEEKQQDQDKTINELAKSHAETKVYVKIILEKLEGIEGNMSKTIHQALTDAMTERMADRKQDAKERKDGSEERKYVLDKYINLIKFVVGVTLGALIGGVVAWLKRGGT